MQQELRDTGVHKLIKRIVLLISFVLIFSNAFAQNDDGSFKKSFSAKLDYPRALWSQCIPTFANLMIEISDNGSVQNIEVSDSAPQLFQNQINKIKSKLKTDLLKSVISSNNLRNCNIIIPVFYIYEADYCGNSFDQAKQPFNNYFIFNGKPLNKMSLNLRPIVVILHKPRE